MSWPQGKQGDYLQFSLASNETSYITYRQIRLYYSKFEHDTFGTLTEQYKKITKEDLHLNINGLMLEDSLPIQSIIQTPEEEKVFEYVLGQADRDQLHLPKNFWFPFNTIVARIIHSGRYRQELLPSGFQQKQGKQEEWPMLAYWIDDVPQNNTEIIQKYLRPARIEVVQLKSTNQMIARLAKEYGQRKASGTKMVFISDMSRLEGNTLNHTAGIDLFEHLYHSLKLEEPGIAFVGNAHQTLKAMALRKLKMDSIAIVQAEEELVSLLYKHFGIPPKK